MGTQEALSFLVVAWAVEDYVISILHAVAAETDGGRRLTDLG